MPEPLSPDQIFIRKLTEITQANLGNEHFGVKELGRESGISLYRLNRRLHSITKKTSNQFIREIRLKKALEMLHNEEYTVAEVAYKTGFGSSNYFNKCFHEYYGYSPGKIKKTDLFNLEQNSLNHEYPNRGKTIWRKYVLTLPGILLLVFITVLTISLIYRKIYKSEWSDGLISKDGRVSLAIFPFRNLTNDPAWDIWQEGIQSSLISFFANSEELIVREPVNQFLESKGLTDYAALTPSLDNIIAKKFDASVFISGSIINKGTENLVTAQIFDTHEKEAIKAFEVEVPATRDRIYELIDSLRRQVRDFLVVTKLKKQDPNSAYYFFDPISSPDAYHYMVLAKKAERALDFPSAVDFYKKALKIDSAIYDAYCSIAVALNEQGDLENCKRWLRRYYGKYEKLNMYNKIFADYLYAITFKTPKEAIRYVEQMININNQAPYNYINLGDEYNKLFQYEKAIPAYEKAFEIYHSWDVKPAYLINYTELGRAYHYSGRYREEKKLYKKAETEFPDNPSLIDRQAILSLSEGDTTSANHYIRKYKILRRDQSWSEAKINNGVAVVYSQGGFQMKAEENYRLAYLKEPENTKWMNNLGFFLINENRNVDEGLYLIEKALKISPDDYSLLDSKGWGLYKKGKYQEAMELMRRSWDLRLQNSLYNHASYLRLEEVKKAALVQN
jgi:AraC-like DNA-binding protein/tetratricopeptide (TPR) repeat protein